MSVVFETERLRVRPLRSMDLDAFHAMQGNPNVMLYTTGRAMTREESREELQSVIDLYGQQDNDFWVWAIVRKSDRDFVGTCALIRNDKGEWEIGYRFLEAYWGNRYGTETTKGLVRYALEQTPITELVAYVNKNNTPSVKILDATFQLVDEYYNAEEDCVDRYYKINRD